jgi:subtilase family serine protease
MAHSIAPDADLVLIEAESAGGADIEEAVSRGIKYLNKNYGGGVMSLSTGFAAESAGQIVFEQIVSSQRARNITFVAASGFQPLHLPPPDPVLNPILPNVGGWPSNSPNVVVVGASTLYLDPAGFRVPGITPGLPAGGGGGGGGGGNTVSLDVYADWTDNLNNCTEFPSVPGGEGVFWDNTDLQVENNYGQSQAFPAPFFQQERGVDPTFGGRAVPDVVWHGDLRLGVSFYSSSGFEGNSGWFTSGGSSVSAPSFAGLLAIANQLRADRGKKLLGNTALQKIYRLGDRGPDAYFNDMTFENLGGLGHYLGQAGCPVGPTENILQAGGAPAGDGYDLASGWGSPNAHTLIPALADQPLGRTINRRAVVTGQFLIIPLTQGGTGTGTGGSGGTGGLGGGGYFPTPTTGSFTSVYARNTARVRGLRTLELDSVLFPAENNLVFTMGGPATGGTGTGGTTVTTTTYDMAIMGVDSQTGESIAPTIDPVLATFTPGTPIRLVRNGDRVTGLAWVSVSVTTTGQNNGGGGGGGGGGTVTQELRQYPARIRGSINNSGQIDAEFFTVDPITFQRIRTPFNLNGIPVFRGRIRT